jgi:hypothetical protein
MLMNKIIMIGIVFAVAFVSFNAAGQVPSDYTPQAREVAGILYEMGKSGQVEVTKTDGRREISFKFTPTTDIDSFFRRSNLSEAIYIDCGKNGPSDEDTLITRMSFIIRGYDKVCGYKERFDGKRASSDFSDAGLKGTIDLVYLNMPLGATEYDHIHYLEVSGQDITSDAEKYGVVMGYIKEKLIAHQRKSKK